MESLVPFLNAGALAAKKHVGQPSHGSYTQAGRSCLEKITPA